MASAADAEPTGELCLARGRERCAFLVSRADLPVVDGDGMGRAFPELQMETFGVYGVPASPLAIADERGHTAIVDTGTDNHRTEWFADPVTA